MSTAAPVVVIRADAGPAVGLGHLRRCLALARALRSLGADARFVIAGDPTPLAGTGFEADPITPDRDLEDTLRHARTAGAHAVVVDSYAVDAAYLRALVAGGFRVLAVDDTGDRELPVDLVVNPAATADRPRYRAAAHTRFLIGIRHAMLQPEFADCPQRTPADRVRRVLITLGGMRDVGAIVAAISRWTAACLRDVAQDIVVGPWAAAAPELTAPGALPSVRLHEHPRDVRVFMLAADLAVCAGGQTPYELAATGTPAIAIRLAENQTLTLAALERAGTLVAAGDATDPNLESAVTSAVYTLAKDRDRRAAMARQARAAVDGQGALRVAAEVLALGRAA